MYQSVDRDGTSETARDQHANKAQNVLQIVSFDVYHEEFHEGCDWSGNFICSLWLKSTFGNHWKSDRNEFKGNQISVAHSLCPLLYICYEIQ